MRLLLFGATGMVGQGVLRECEAADDVTEVVAIVRSPLKRIAAKVTEIVHHDFFNWPADGPDAVDLGGFDACFFCLGVSSVGMKEPAYRRVTVDLTTKLAEALVRQSPQAVFVYVSGAGTSAQGRQMWARVKAEAERAVAALPFRAVYCFRPGYIQPMHGVRSKVGWYNAVYAAIRWAEPLLMRFAPKYATTTENVGCAMLQVARDGWPHPILGNVEINAAAAQWTAPPFPSAPDD